jgi:hypothetical protein
MRGPLRESELVERPPDPDLLHSPSKTGANALMARGEREQRLRAMLPDDAQPSSLCDWFTAFFSRRLISALRRTGMV